ncbi:hypothetical protein BU14_0204s0001 [Porphyra umbilicalis]|uniref:Uncharacterized protein n=1 Tax=Porphyra umbilicalis TaxID=2786 RepID=A0A1X6P5Y6_PORUM|nr:hypothetical protein BU14_0204s0001 [Porphyra umbilicalis]|eukprot:OSX76155.1 hypothetical protein BU14_0204s0001 [Porphyra umbilicalis]
MFSVFISACRVHRVSMIPPAAPLHDGQCKYGATWCMQLVKMISLQTNALRSVRAAKSEDRTVSQTDRRSVGGE